MRYRISAADDPAGWTHGVAHPSRPDLRCGGAGGGHPLSRDVRLSGDEVRSRRRVHAASDRGAQHEERGLGAARVVGVLRAPTGDVERGDQNRPTAAGGVSEHSVGRIEAGAAPRVPRPSAGVVAIVAAATATALGTGMDVGSTAAQIAAATAVAAFTVAVVPLAARRQLCLITYSVASASAGAAAIHYAVIAEHFDEWWGFGLFCVASAVAQLAWAMAVVASRSRLLMWVGVVGNAAIVVLWIVTRTVGTLVGPEPATPEPIALADSLATAFEIA